MCPAEAKDLPLWHAKQHPSRISRMELSTRLVPLTSGINVLLHSFFKNKGKMQSDPNNSPPPTDQDVLAAETVLSAGRQATM